MRFRLRTRPVVLFLALVLAALLALLPMRLLLGLAAPPGFAAREVTGPVWRAQLVEARVGRIPLGDVRASVSPLSLLLGRVRVAVHGVTSDGPALDGSVSLVGHGFRVDDLTATLPAGTLFAPLPLSALTLTGLTVHFRDDACEAAAGRVRATLAGELGGVPLDGSLEGAVRCEASALLVPLASPGGDQAIVLRIRGDGRYRAELSMRPGDPAVAARLAAAGFAQSGAGYRLAVDGRLR